MDSLITHSLYNRILNNHNNKLWLKLLQFVIKDQDRQIIKMALLMLMDNLLQNKMSQKTMILVTI